MTHTPFDTASEFCCGYIWTPISQRSIWHLLRKSARKNITSIATALAKQWDAAIPYLEKKKLSDWVHKKTIQKAVESYRITKEQKEYLRTLKKMVY